MKILGEIYSVNDEKYRTGALYQAIKSELDLDKSFCSLPSGEFSMWLGNVWDFDIDKAGNWTEYKTGQQLDFDLETIKTPSNPEVSIECVLHSSENCSAGSLSHQRVRAIQTKKVQWLLFLRFL